MRVWLAGLIVALGACCPTPTPDGGTTSTSGGLGSIGPCAADGGCPINAYCEPLLVQCPAFQGLAQQIDVGSCYLNDPCSSCSGSGCGGFNSTDCSGSSCGSDLDCGSLLTCQGGICAAPNSGFATGTGPVCPNVPTPCPADCPLLQPVHGCTVCLCASCPFDGGVDGG